MSQSRVRAHFDHKFAKKNLSAYLDNALSERERRRVRHHLEHCADCRHDLATLRATQQALHALPLKPVPRSFALPASVQQRQVSFRRWNMAYGAMRGLTVAVSFVLVLLLSGDALMGMDVIPMFGQMQPKSAPVALESAPMEPEVEVIVEKEAEKASGNQQLLAPAGAGKEGEGKPETEIARTAENPVQEIAAPAAKSLAQATPSPSTRVLTAKRVAAPAPTGAGAHILTTPAEQTQKVVREAAQVATKTALPEIVVKEVAEEGEATREATSADWEQPKVGQPAGPVAESPLLKLWGDIRLLSGLLLGILLMLLAGLIWTGQKRRI